MLQPSLVLKSIAVQTTTMTHDTPNQDKTLRWCSHCQLAVDPTAGATGEDCPSCGQPLPDGG